MQVQAQCSCWPGFRIIASQEAGRRLRFRVALRQPGLRIPSICSSYTDYLEWSRVQKMWLRECHTKFSPATSEPTHQAKTWYAYARIQAFYVMKQSRSLNQQLSTSWNHPCAKKTWVSGDMCCSQQSFKFLTRYSSHQYDCNWTA